MRLVAVLSISSSYKMKPATAGHNDGKVRKGNVMTAKDVLEKYKVEINSHDFDRLIPLISKECQFWFTSGTYVGLDQTRKAFEKTWGMIKKEVYTISDLEWIAESEKAAVCIYTYHWSGLIDGQQQSGKGRGTSCFRKEGDGWKIVHEHLSAFPKTT